MVSHEHSGEAWYKPKRRTSLMRVGEITVLPLFDGMGYEPARKGWHRSEFAEDPWRRHMDALDADGRLVLTHGGYLVITGDRKLLVDAGVGPVDTVRPRGGHHTGGAILASLSQYGLDPSDVTDVVFTHLHFDHVGWASLDGKPVFKNASYRLHAADWDYFVSGENPVGEAVEKLAVLSGHLEIFDSACALAPGVDTRPTPGHTPGSTVYVVSSRGERLFFIGDVAHSVVELLESGWESIFDVCGSQAQTARSELVEEVLVTGAAVAGAHFPQLQFGRLGRAGDGLRWLPL